VCEISDWITKEYGEFNCEAWHNITFDLQFKAYYDKFIFWKIKQWLFYQRPVLSFLFKIGYFDADAKFWEKEFKKQTKGDK
jgi:hypothetical protein